MSQLDGKLDDIVNLLNLPRQSASQQSLKSGSCPLSLLALSGSSPCKQNTAPSSVFSGPSAFLGPTSFSAVFHDNRDNFEHTGAPPSVLIATSPHIPHAAVDEPRFSSDLVTMGAKVLLQIPNEAACNVLFSRHINPDDGFIRLSCERLSSSIWPTFGRILARRDDREMKSLAQLTFRNTNSEFHEEDDPLKWFESFSGHNIRWEAIGILFTYWAFGTLGCRECDPIFTSASGKRKERREMMIELKECAASCIIFCSHTDHGNPLLVYLLYKTSLLESMISGDASELRFSLGIFSKFQESR